MNHLKYSVDLPYPSTECIKPNSHDCGLIMQDYAGYVSEITATTQYFYHHLYAGKDGYEEIAETLMGIGIAEMHHLDILGKVILKLGGDPKLLAPVNCKRAWWCGDKVDYSKNIEQIILKDIMGEKAAINAYSKHAKMVCQESVSATLKRIVLDEELHLETLNNILKGIRSLPHNN